MHYVNIIIHYWLYSVGTSRTGLSLVAKHPNLWDCAKHGVRFRLTHTVPQWAYCIALNFLGTEIYRLASCKFHGNKYWRFELAMPICGGCAHVQFLLAMVHVCFIVVTCWRLSEVVKIVRVIATSTGTKTFSVEAVVHGYYVYQCIL